MDEMSGMVLVSRLEVLSELSFWEVFAGLSLIPVRPLCISQLSFIVTCYSNNLSANAGLLLLGVPSSITFCEQDCKV